MLSERGITEVYIIFYIRYGKCSVADAFSLPDGREVPATRAILLLVGRGRLALPVFLLWGVYNPLPSLLGIPTRINNDPCGI